MGKILICLIEIFSTIFVGVGITWLIGKAIIFIFNLNIPWDLYGALCIWGAFYVIRNLFVGGK